MRKLTGQASTIPGNMHFFNVERLPLGIMDHMFSPIKYKTRPKSFPVTTIHMISRQFSSTPGPRLLKKRKEEEELIKAIAEILTPLLKYCILFAGFLVLKMALTNLPIGVFAAILFHTASEVSEKISKQNPPPAIKSEP